MNAAEILMGHVSVGGAEVWCVTITGVVCRRLGVTQDNPGGTSWLTGLDVSILMFLILITLCEMRTKHKINTNHQRQTNITK